MAVSKDGLQYRFVIPGTSLLCMGLFSRFCVQARRFTAEAASGTHEIVSAKDGYAFRLRSSSCGGQVALHTLRF